MSPAEPVKVLATWGRDIDCLICGAAALLGDS